ncbi:thiol reductant ABC exporter subunit CydD [Marinomonas balearica]|uniref:ATP-binding cassette subfamily C protein CydD n=1 Tax=Marinomonas balearica TaxID=491947 RepID=A0A4R6MDD9_9GAMM|nr:thiol reductant ABC exporter subunit CydD [Marinomonas balearica]TDO99573.1 ATP-binding cassette subfamily C protein CydD [Marinomonas balearica]
MIKANAKSNKADKRSGRVLTPERLFLKDLAQPEKATYRTVNLLGILIAVGIVLQAFGLAFVFSDLVLNAVADLQMLVLAGVGFLLRISAQYFRDVLSASASRNIRFSLRQKALSHLADLGPKRHQIEEDAALSTRVYEQIDALDDFFTRYKPQAFLVAVIPCVILASVVWVSWIAFGIFMLTAPLVILFMILVGHKAAQANRKQFKVLSLLSNQFSDLNQGLAELNRLGQTTTARNRLSDSAERYQKTTMGVLRLAFLSTGTLELFASVSIAMVALYLGLGLLEQLPWSVGSSPVTLSEAFFLLLLAPEFYLPLRQLGSDYHAKQKAEAASTDLIDLFNVKADSHTAAFHKPESSLSEEANGNDQIMYPTFESDALIVMRHMGWEQAGRQRLAPFTGSIHEGERVWLKGESGIGKSSLMTILLGFEQQYEGSLKVAGGELTATNLSQWRNRLAWIPQKPEWVQGTIRQNLELGIGRCTEAALREALIQAKCWDFVLTLKYGLDSTITEAGTGLSGGQMQRLSIARALLTQADIWLLDEPCSGLDEDTAEHVLNTIDDVSHGKTMLIISHDTHPVFWADTFWTLTKEGVHAKAQIKRSYV